MKAIMIALLALSCVLQTVRGASFALDPHATQHAVFPFDRFQKHHSCFTAYFEAGRLVKDVANVYAEALYLTQPGRSDRPSWQPATDARRTLTAFYVDPYEYPPTFLLLSNAVVALAGDFVRARAVWFFLQTAIVLGALLLLALQLEDKARARFMWLAPLVYLSLPVQICLQLGNFQIGTIALAIIAMLAIARGHELVGSAVLAFVTLAKLFPFVLLILFLRRTTWRPLWLSLAWMGVWTGLAVAILGWAPFEAFWSHHLPRIASGEAFPQLRIPYAVAINHSVQAVSLKLALFGVGTGSQRLGAIVAAVYTVVPCAAAWLLQRARPAPLAWLLLLALGTYRSPFLPQEYASIGPVFVLGIIAASIRMSRARWAAVATAYILLQLQIPWGVSNEPLLGALTSVVAQVTAAAVFLAALRILARDSELVNPFRWRERCAVGEAGAGA